MANAVTFLRVIIALFVLLIIKINSPTNIVALFLIIISMLLDALDGFIARHLRTSSPRGSILDILADRIIENIFFIYFATMSLFSFWIPVLIIIRGLTIDAIRTMFVPSGKTAFGANTFHSLNWTKFLACSRLSRGSYNTFKMLTFVCYGALVFPQGYLFHFISTNKVQLTAEFCLWTTIIISLIRAMPVLLEGRIALYK